MLFAQFAGLDSLREIEQALGAQPGGLYHLGLRVPRVTNDDVLNDLPGTLERIRRAWEGQAHRQE